MRTKLLGEPTARQSQIALSAATADMDNDQTDDQIMQSKQQQQQQQQQQQIKNQQIMVTNSLYTIHYEQRFNTLKKDMHQVYDDVFHDTPAMYTKMVVGTRNRRDAKNELIRKRPKRTLLRNTITQRKYHSQISSSLKPDHI